MLAGWGRFKGWLVLEFFLAGNRRIHVRGLARQLRIGASTAQTYLSGYEKQGILEKEKTANVALYKLKETPLTLELKKAFFISKMMPFVPPFRKENPSVTSLALFGSHAKGTFDNKSDIDLVAVSQERNVSTAQLKKLEEHTGKEVRIQTFSYAEWKNLLRKKDCFAEAFIKNNILLFGDSL